MTDARKIRDSISFAARDALCHRIAQQRRVVEKIRDELTGVHQVHSLQIEPTEAAHMSRWVSATMRADQICQRGLAEIERRAAM
jgi:hypothetical protein